MKVPATPQNEAERLKTLRSLDILDTPQEERFDRIVRMAKRIFGVPIALVTLVDENRQWFKAHMGLEARETPRDVSFCAHAILGDEIFIVPDALKDERFADNPLVTGEPHIRFYAGCPLRATDGHKLGSLCIIDTVPRHLNNDDLTSLLDLAAMVEDEIAILALATLDHLTGISNRTGFMALAKYSINLCARELIPASLVFLDIDKLKFINDNFGHAEGDKALITFANLFKSTFRDSDVFARLGGDEFVALLVHMSNAEAEGVIERLQQAVDKHNLDSNQGYDLSFSYGIVELDHNRHATIDTLLAEADSTMYKHKRGA